MSEFATPAFRELLSRKAGAALAGM